VKNTSGRIRERHHRAAVDKARQEAANPTLKSSDGCDVPCQARRNSSINFSMDHISQAISESQITPSIGEISGRRSRKAATRPITGVRAPNKHKLALFRRAGNIGSNKTRGRRGSAIIN